MAKVPDLAELENFENFDKIEDLFEVDAVHFDIVGESGFMYSPFIQTIEDVTSGGTTDVETGAFQEVQLGYRVSEDESMPIYFGILFKTELPSDILIDGTGDLVNWAKYERFVNGTVVDSAAAVCIVTNDATTGEKSFEARTYEFGAEGLGDINNPNLESYQVTGSDAIWSILEGVDDEIFYSIDVHADIGMATQSCLVGFEFNLDDIDEEDFGSYQVESGVRLIDATDSSKVYDFVPSLWNTEFREPEEFIPPTVQPVFEVTAEEVNSAGDIISTQNVFVGYEIINDLESDNKMGFIFELDLPATEAVEGAVIYQYAQYRKSLAFGDQWVGVACVTTVGGGSDAAEVYNFRSFDELTGTDAGTPVTYWVADADKMIYEPTEESPEWYQVRYGDEGAYETTEYSEIEGNRLQRCVAELDFPKFGMEEFYNEYDVKIGSRVYVNDAAESFTQKESKEDKKEFAAPQYDDEIIDEISSIEDRHIVHVLSKYFEKDAGEVFTGVADSTIMTTYLDI